MSYARSHLWNEANAAYERGDFLECRRHCESALQDEPQNPSYHLLLGISLAEAGRIGDAEAPILRSLELQPDNATGWAAYGNVLSALGKNEQALESYNRALGLDTANFVAWLNLGVLFHKTGRYEEAVISYSSALELVPHDPLSLSNRALSLHELSRYREALIDLDLVTQILPLEADGYLHRGNVHQAMKAFPSARQDYARAIQLNGENIQAIIGDANALAGMGYLGEGERELRRGIATCPTSREAYFSLGNMQRDRKDLVGAQHSYDRALEIDPEFIRAKRNKGLVALLSGDFERGFRSMNTAKS
jgi:tetratricopeptide (TPR) repeat protein